MTTTLTAPRVRHPATYSAALLPVFAELLALYECQTVLDPMAGTGKIHQLRQWLPNLHTVGIELEPEWATMHPDTQHGNALALPFGDGEFDAVCTSPTYGNRMADHHEARDGSTRHTYRHALGRPLHPDNSGAMPWGEPYRDFHIAAWTEARRVLQHGGLFLLNVKDFYRRGQLVEVTGWHVERLQALGFRLVEWRKVNCPGQRHGANGALRVDFENVIGMRKDGNE